jgi:hypothetical protein
MHEGAHAGMGDEQFGMSESAQEYGAFVGQFPESTYLRLRSFVQHPASMIIKLPVELLQMLNISPDRPESIKRIIDLLKFVDGAMYPISPPKLQGELKEQMIRLEIMSKKKGKPLMDIPRNWQDNAGEFLANRYEDLPGGREFINKFGKAISDMMENKSQITVTTNSSPALFNVRYSHKKEDEEDGKGN